MTKPDFFLVLEGLDGSGKSEISRRLTAYLTEQRGVNRVLLTYEPYDPFVAGEYLRQALRKEIRVRNHTLALAYALNRADHLDRLVNPFLNGDGGIVICDRYLLSSLVYQSRDGLSMDDVMLLNAGARTPDLTLFMEVTPETTRQRMQGRAVKELFDDQAEEMRQQYHTAIRYLEARGHAFRVIDANGTIDEVLAAVIAAVTPYLPPAPLTP
ncbi:MAG: dTMP kinase [Chloroflexi bacterium]|nr:dTMP kinase [Chloroflexota bacterium]